MIDRGWRDPRGLASRGMDPAVGDSVFDGSRGSRGLDDREGEGGRPRRGGRSPQGGGQRRVTSAHRAQGVVQAWVQVDTPVSSSPPWSGARRRGSPRSAPRWPGCRGTRARAARGPGLAGQHPRACPAQMVAVSVYSWRACSRHRRRARCPEVDVELERCVGRRPRHDGRGGAGAGSCEGASAAARASRADRLGTSSSEIGMPRGIGRALSRPAR